MNAQKHEPYTVYLADVSYFSGKLETYLRYKEIPFQRKEMNASNGVKEVYANTGLRKVPSVKTTDGLWLKDTTPMIEWFEKAYPEHSIIPSDPVLRFVSKLVEDYADEWCWRTAMYYRWRSNGNARFLGSRIGQEVFSDWPLPANLAGKLFCARQRHTFLKGDGLTKTSEPAIRHQYFDLLESLSKLLIDQPFLLGNKPTLVDIAFMGPFFRHYYCDPVPAKIMRDNYPAVNEWVARMWNARCSQQEFTQNLSDFTHVGWQFILQEILQDYLPYLQKNAESWGQGKRKFTYESTKVTLHNIPVVHYRVYCLEMLENQYQSLDTDTRACVDKLFAPYGALTLGSKTHSGLIEEYQLPLRPRGQTGFLENLSVFFFGTPWDMKKHPPNS